MVDILIEKIDPNPFQSRIGFDENKIRELAESINSVGLLQKILVRPHHEAKGRYQIAHGDRRIRACKHLKRKTIPADVRELSDKDMAEIMVIENTQRADLNPIEEARGYQILIDKFGYSKKGLAEKIGKSRPYVSNSVRLLTLDSFLKCCVLCKTLSVWHSRIIQGLPEGYRKYQLADTVMDWNLSVAETRKIVNDIKNGKWFTSFAREVNIQALIEYKQFADLFTPLSPYEYKELTSSMRAQGQIAPIQIDGLGVVLDGHRRVRSSLKLGWKTMKAEIIRFAYEYKGELKGFYPSVAAKKIPAFENRPSLIPEMDEDKRKRLKRLGETLLQIRTHIEKQISKENEGVDT